MPLNRVKPQQVGVSHGAEIVKRLAMWLYKIGFVAIGLIRWCGPIACAQSANDGFDPDANLLPAAFAIQPDGKIIIAGYFTIVGGTNRDAIARLNVDGSVDATFGVVPEAPVLSLVLQPDGKMVVGGHFSVLNGEPHKRLGRLNADGSVDRDFRADANYLVTSLALQADGKILVGGDFTTLGEQSRTNLGRLNRDGSVDTTFTAGANGGLVQALAVQADGKIVVGGNFTMLGGNPRSYLARLNADGSVDTAFDPGVLGEVLTVAIQPDGKIVAGGEFGMIGGKPRYFLGRLHPDGRLDESFNPGAENIVKALRIQVDGKIVLGGGFTMLGGEWRHYLGRLNADGTVDLTFNPGANDWVSALGLQADGKILVGGSFTVLGGRNRNRLGRLYREGTLDHKLNPGADEPVTQVAIQPDDKILVAGLFTTLGGRARNPLARLNADGAVDLSFNCPLFSNIKSVVVLADGKILVGGYSRLFLNPLPGYVRRLHANGSIDTSFYPGVTNFDDNVECLAVQADGKILVGGNFLSVDGQSPRARIARLNSDGTLEPGFDPGADAPVTSLAVQPDGKILVGGSFNRLGGLTCHLLGRLNTNGTLDVAFNPAPGGDGPFSPASVRCLNIQPDGKILVGGWFLNFAGQPHPYLGRVNSDGTLDSTFNTAFPTLASVSSLVLQADGKVLVAGEFDRLDGEPRASFARLNADGSVDQEFVSRASNGSPAYIDGALGIAAQTDGKIIIVGNFTTVNGEIRTNVARLTSGTPALQALSISPSGITVTWTRSGSAPEVEQVVFEKSSDGIAYSWLGNADRLGGAWVLRPARTAQFPLGANFYLRARGRTVGGQNNASSGLIESVAQFWRLPPPFISSVQIVGGGVFQFTFANTNATAFSVWATSELDLTPANWQRLGSPVPVGDGVYQFSDPGATNFARWFYQLRFP